ncbi:Ig-like domain-containing protein [Spirosoma aerolatum]|uniref:Ig-like domain-containing protein n=1 Tax=Spirosoma aerolatum TaxID=1211326 RepID=UPI001475571C|nr:Ig-like domain-containing protein [Spirosoma aerolatum]
MQHTLRAMRQLLWLRYGIALLLVATSLYTALAFVGDGYLTNTALPTLDKVVKAAPSVPASHNSKDKALPRKGVETKATIAFAPDSDGDGVTDDVDLDDDNDGILDVNEGCNASLIQNEYQGTFGLTSACRPSSGTVTNYVYSCGVTSGVVEGGYAIVNGSILGSWNQSWRNIQGHSTSNPNDAYLFVNGNVTAQGIFYTGTFTVTTTGSYKFGAWVVNPIKAGTNFITPNLGVRIINTATSAQVGNITSGNLPEGGNWQELSTTLSLVPGTYKIEMYNSSLGAYGNDFALDDVYLLPVPCNADLDGDGLVNSLDLDSDGDGCPDALEGGASFAQAKLIASSMPGGNSGTGYTGTSATPITQNLGNAVDANGVPTLAGTSGQTAGTSQNAAIKAAVCVINANNDAATTQQNTPVNIPVLTNDTNNGTQATNTNVTVSLLTPPAVGTAMLNSDGTFTYTPPPGYSGTATFLYTICDKTSPTVCSTATVGINVSCSDYSMIVSDVNTSQLEVFKVGSTGPKLTCVINASGGEGVAANQPTGILYALKDALSVYVYNYQKGQLITQIPLSDRAPDLTLSPDGAYLYVATWSAVQKYSTATNTLVASAPNANLQSVGELWGIAVNPITGNVYTSAGFRPTYSNKSTIQYISPSMTGATTTLVTAPSGYYYRGITFDSQGYLWAVMSTSGLGSGGPDKLVKYDAITGAVLGTYTLPVPNPSSLSNGSQVAFDVAVGPDGNLYIATLGGDCVTKFDVNTNTFSTFVPYAQGTGSKALTFLCGPFYCTTQITANPDLQTTTQCTAVNVPVLTNDTYAGATPTTSNVKVTVTSQPANGTATVNSDGTIKFTPTCTFTGSTTFAYSICEVQNTTNCAASTVTVNVVGVKANNDVATTPQNTPVNIPVLTNDTNNGAQATNTNVTVSLTNPPVSGTATLNPDGTFTYTPPPGFSGPVSFTYTICDKTSPTVCSRAVVGVNVSCSNYSLLVSEYVGKRLDVFNYGQSSATFTCARSNFGGEGAVTNPTTNLAYIVLLEANSTGPNRDIAVYNYATGTVVTRISTVPGLAIDIALSPDGLYAYVAGTGGVSKISTTTNTVLTTNTSRSFNWGVAVNPNTGNVYVSGGWEQYYSSGGTSTISYIAPSLSGSFTNLVTAPSGYYYRGITFDAAGNLWAVMSPDPASGPDKLVKYDANTGAVLGTYSFPVPVVNGTSGGTSVSAWDIAVGPDGNLYIGTMKGDCITKFDVTTNTFSTYIPYVSGAGAKGLAFVCGTFYCTTEITANPDSQTTTQCTAVNVPVLTNDTYAGNTPTTSNVKVTVTSQPANGTATVNSDGTIRFAPACSFTGVTTFTYSICEVQSTTNCSSTTVTITVNRVPDSDGDGLPDNIDLDDDNDGILDIYEDCTASLVTEEFQGTFGQTSVCRASTSSVTSYAFACQPNAGQYTILNQSIPPTWNNPVFQALNGHSSTAATDAYMWVNGSSAVGVFYSGQFTVTTANTYNFGCWAANMVKAGTNIGLPNVGVRIINTATSAQVSNITSGNLPEGGTWQQVGSSVTLSPGTYRLEMYNIGTAISGNDFGVDDIYVTPASCNNDIDGDGIPNRLDLDSDGDGCADALEGGASFTNANLVASSMPGGNSGAGYTGTSTNPITTNLCASAACVDANGVPTIAGASGQLIGTSQDATQQDVACCTSLTPVLSATSKSNVCPITTVDLSTITASNTPASYTLAWFSGTPATAANKLSSVNSLTAGTYYAAFTNGTCYGPTAPVSASVLACFDCANITVGGKFVAGFPSSGTLTVPISGAKAGSFTLNLSGTGFSTTPSPYVTTLTASQTAIAIPVQYDGSGSAGVVSLSLSSPQAGNSCTPTVPVTPAIPCAPLIPGQVVPGKASVLVGDATSFTYVGKTQGSTVRWFISPSNTVSPNQGTGTVIPSVSFLQPGYYQIIFEETNSTSPAGCNIPSTVQSTLDYLVKSPTPVCAYPGSSTVTTLPTVAAVKIGQMGSFSLVGGQPYNNVQWEIIPSAGATPNSGSGAFTSNITFSQEGLFRAVFTMTNLGDGTCTPVQKVSAGLISVGLDPCAAPSPIDVLEASGKDSTLVGTTATFNAVGGVPRQSIIWKVYPTTGVSSVSGTGSSATITFSQTGDYVVTFIATNGSLPLNCTKPTSIAGNRAIKVYGPTVLPPIATPDINTTRVNTPVPGNVLTNDNDPNSPVQSLTVTLISPPPVGTVSLNPDGSYVYTPPTNFTGTTTFCYKATNTSGLSSTACATITVVPDPVPAGVGNNPPVPNNDATQTTVGTPVKIVILGNDTDPDSNTSPNGQLNTPVLLGQPAQGTAILNPDGSVTYTPPTGFTGVVTFPYQVCDKASSPLCATALVTVTVLPTPAAGTPLSPVAVDDALLTLVNTPKQGTVASNDSDPNNPALPLTFTGGQPSHGTVVLNPDGTYTYTPTTNYSGPDSFTYNACNTAGKCDKATVYIVVLPPTIQPPIATPDINTTRVNTPVPGNVSTNDNDPQNQPLTFTLITPPPVGTVSLNPDGSYVYTPPTNFTGTTSFCYKATNTSGLSSTACVTVDVLPDPSILQNNPPAPNNDATQTTVGTPVKIVILGNDTDPDSSTSPNGQLNTPVLLGQPAQGTAILNPDGSVTYTPPTGFTGVVTFPYQVCDKASSPLCATALVTVTVLPAPPAGTILPPVAVDDALLTNINTPKQGTVASNDSDPNNPALPLTYTSGQPSHGTVTMNPDGSYTYTPTTNYSGPDSFTYTVCNTASKCDKATVYIVIQQPKGLLLMPKAWLQGALFGVTDPNGLMRDDLRVKGYLPASSPYASLNPITPVGPISNTATVFGVTGANAIVDWVFVELRNPANPSQIIDSRAALIQRDGDIVDLDGQSPVSFTAAQGSYYVAVRHRNHLGVMTASAIPLSFTSTVVDFRTPSTPTYRISTSAVNQPEVTVAQGVALWAGNVLYDKSVIYQGTTNDVSAISQQVKGATGNVTGTANYILQGYNTADVNMDGQAIYQGTGNDVNYIYLNVTKNHPGNVAGQNFFVIPEQLP